jgi:hypothetical protein
MKGFFFATSPLRKIYDILSSYALSTLALFGWAPSGSGSTLVSTKEAGGDTNHGFS